MWCDANHIYSFKDQRTNINTLVCWSIWQSRLVSSIKSLWVRERVTKQQSYLLNHCKRYEEGIDIVEEEEEWRNLSNILFINKNNAIGMAPLKIYIYISSSYSTKCAILSSKSSLTHRVIAIDKGWIFVQKMVDDRYAYDVILT